MRKLTNSTKIKRDVVGHSHPHDSAIRHTTGQAVYIDDMPDLPGTLHIAPVLSPIAHGKLLAIETGAAEKHSGVVCILTASDIPAHNDIAPILKDEPVFAEGKVEHVGQIVAAVVATSFAAAQQAARLVEVKTKKLKPNFSLDLAHANKSVTHPTQHLKSGNVNKALKDAPRKFSGRVEMGGQDHFYLEGHVAYAIPGEDDDMTLWSSTQHPTEVQIHVAAVLGLKAHNLDVQVRRMGGGFGGKESQPTIIAAIAALAARKTKQPCRFRLRRHDDMAATGKRHGFVVDWQVGVDDSGRLLGLKAELLANSGHVADLSGPVVTRALTHIDNCYHLPATDLLGVCAKTNTVSNTAFRGFGGPQGMVAIEAIIDTVSRQLGIEPNVMRARNYYSAKTGSTTPYDQKIGENRIAEIVDRVLYKSDWDKRRKSIDAFNRKNTILKKGLAMMPVKFGISFNMPSLNQAGSLVNVYKDGSVSLNHGGTEMGQGLNTKVAQVVAEVFALPLSQIKITTTDTSKVPNTSATAASSGSDINGMAAFNAASEIKKRMTKVAAKKLGGKLSDVKFAKGRVRLGRKSLSFEQVANRCWFERVSLSATGFYKTPKIHWDGAKMKGHPFFYFTYGAAVSEVVIDTLTGENRCLRTDIIQDCGTPLNPTLDLGQIEGAFVQGMGWLTCEELWWDEEGRLRTIGPSTYKIPGSRDVPPVFNVEVLDNKPNREATIFRSKAVGEPPLMLAISVWLALRDAVSSLSGGKLPANLDAPATPERVLMAVEDMKRQVAKK